MPRQADPVNAYHRLRQQRYRGKLVAQQVPEASVVDLAMARAAAGYIDAIEAGYGTPSDRVAMRALLRGTLDLLVLAGYDRKGATAVLRRRVTRQGRVDMDTIVAASRIRSRLARG